MSGRAIGTEVEVDHTLGDDPVGTLPCWTGVVNGMLKVEKDTRLHTVIAVVDQHRAALQERAVPFESQVQHGVEERVSGTNERRMRGCPRGATRDFSKAMRW